MTMTPLVSVIVPVYNTERWLPRCLDSILAQSYPNLEVILVDDGSQDGCPQICHAYTTADPRVRVIHQKNSGVSAARNAGNRRRVGRVYRLCRQRRPGRTADVTKRWPRSLKPIKPGSRSAAIRPDRPARRPARPIRASWTGRRL